MSANPQTKRERRLAARAERQRLAEEGRRRAKRNRAIMWGLMAILALAVLGGGGYLLIQNLTRPAIGVSVPDEGTEHVTPGTPLTYRNRPPASGPHYAQSARPGVYSEPLDPGLWVHSLEHGYIVVLYNCPDGCPDEVAKLRSFYEAAPKTRLGYQKVVITPYSNMDSRITALAWNRKLEMQTVDQDKLMEFYKAYLDKGPEPGAP